MTEKNLKICVNVGPENTPDKKGIDWPSKI